MRVLVVGGAGYVGGGVTDYLQEMGHETRVYDALFYEESYRKAMDFVYGDVRDHERLLPQLKWAEVVVWLAALVGDGACSLNPDITEVINQQEVKWLADHFEGRIIFMSTCSVYGAQDVVLDETSPTNPLSVYASTKLAAEQHLAGRNALIFRLGTLFGVSDQFARIRLDLVVNTLVLKAATVGKLTVFGGDQFRPLLHVKDVARAIAQNVATVHTGIYNLHRQNVRIVDLAYQVRNHFPDTQIEQTPMKFQDARNYRVQSDKAVQTLGFNPLVSIDDGIEEVKRLILEGRIRDFDNPRYSNQAFLSKFSPHLQHTGA
jgi:nucleoside-diphosphate-sugar epimerase